MLVYGSLYLNVESDEGLDLEDMYTKTSFCGPCSDENVNLDHRLIPKPFCTKTEPGRSFEWNKALHEERRKNKKPRDLVAAERTTNKANRGRQEELKKEQRKFDAKKID